MSIARNSLTAYFDELFLWNQPRRASATARPIRQHCAGAAQFFQLSRSFTGIGAHATQPARPLLPARRAAASATAIRRAVLRFAAASSSTTFVLR